MYIVIKNYDIALVLCIFPYMITSAVIESITTAFICRYSLEFVINLLKKNKHKIAIAYLISSQAPIYPNLLLKQSCCDTPRPSN